MSDVLLHMQGISKRFGAVQALQGVDLAVKKGTVHALIGENGAGKSTLMKILAGSLKPDEGAIALGGAQYQPQSPKEGRNQGVSMIYQELNLAPHLTVEENITLGVEKRKFGIIKHQKTAVKDALALLGHAHLDLSIKVEKLGIGQKQIVEIARSLLLKSRIIIMDEPTSSLSQEDTIALFAAIKRLKEQGNTIIYISHFLEEIQEIADEYTVLRDGESVATGSMVGTTLSELVTHMVGRSLEEMFPRVEHNIGDILFQAEHISSPPKVQDVSITLRRGEILGIAGLIGAGRTETMRCLFGLDTARSGTLLFPAVRVDLSSGYSSSQALKSGMSMVSENRQDEGLAENLPIRDNVTLSSLKGFMKKLGFIHLANERDAVLARVSEVSLKFNDYLDPCSSLSGGNQQKVALARILNDGSDVLLLDEPTRGIDVRSKVEIYALIGQLAAAGKGVIMVSSYLPELFGICDTLGVMYRGRLSPVKSIQEWTEESVMSWATTGK